MGYIEAIQRKTEEFAPLIEAISNLDMGVPFRIIPEENTIEVSEVSVPDTVTTSDGYDLDLPSEWTAMTGYSGQYGYHGPVMHPSEVDSPYMVEDMCYMTGEHPGTVFAVVPVGQEEEETGDFIGWAVIYRMA